MSEAKLIDSYVGKKIKARRKSMGISQEELGRVVGVTFQQIQKYEKGTNRVSSGRLYQFAKLLKVNVSYFFEGYNEISATKDYDSNDFMLRLPPDNKELTDLVTCFKSIQNTNVRKKIVSLVKSLQGQSSPLPASSSTLGSSEDISDSAAV